MKNGSRKTRLENWSYSAPSTYFITFCTKNRTPLLGKIKVEESPSGATATFIPSRIGEACIEAIRLARRQYPDVRVCSYVLMPNHAHLLIRITEESVHGSSRSLLSRFMGFVKSETTLHSREISEELQLWQRGFYDHIVRDESDYLRIQRYIKENPIRWAVDKFYVDV